jgi:hypothetical protein
MPSLIETHDFPCQAASEAREFPERTAQPSQSRWRFLRIARKRGGLPTLLHKWSKKYDLYGSKHRDGIILFPLAEKQAVENLLLGAFSPVDKKRQLSDSARELAEVRRACLPIQGRRCVRRSSRRRKRCLQRRRGRCGVSPLEWGASRLQARSRGKAFPPRNL